eukprot:EG_transcript_22364
MPRLAQGPRAVLNKKNRTLSLEDCPVWLGLGQDRKAWAPLGAMRASSSSSTSLSLRHRSISSSTLRRPGLPPAAALHFGGFGVNHGLAAFSIDCRSSCCLCCSNNCHLSSRAWFSCSSCSSCNRLSASVCFARSCLFCQSCCSRSRSR